MNLLFRRKSTTTKDVTAEVSNASILQKGRTYEYVLSDRSSDVGIKCLICNRTSWNQNDVKNKYCGNCHEWHEFLFAQKQLDDSTRLLRSSTENFRQWQKKFEIFDYVTMVIVAIGFISWMVLDPIFPRNPLVKMIIGLSIGFSHSYYLIDKWSKIKERRAEWKKEKIGF